MRHRRFGLTSHPPPRWIVFQRDAGAISCRSFHPRRYSSKAGRSPTTAFLGGGFARRSVHRGPRSVATSTRAVS
jgi:hypothetical protein